MVENQAAQTSACILGHSSEEQRRLERQAALMRPACQRWLEESGLAEGMRAVDVGFGPGDLSRLAAVTVGRTGSVLGIDRSADVVNTARRFSTASEFANLSFQACGLNDFACGGPF